MTGCSFVRLKQYTRSCASTVTAAAGISQPAGTWAQSSWTSYVYLPLPTTVSTTDIAFLSLRAACLMRELSSPHCSRRGGAVYIGQCVSYWTYTSKPVYDR